MSIVRQTNKKTGTVYVYEQEPYEVPGVGKRYKRRLIGKVDPASGQIVPTGKQGPQRKHALPLDDTDEVQEAEMKAQLFQMNQRAAELEQEIARQRDFYQRMMGHIRTAAKELKAALEEQP